MAAIDQYDHLLLGFVDCPSSYDIVYGNNTRQIAIYELLEDIPADEDSFDGKAGDILVGGGRGEAPALRIACPNAFYFFTSEDWSDIDDIAKLFKSFWTSTQAYIFGEGYAKLGWNVETEIEHWLAENVCRLLMQSIDKYSHFSPAVPRSSSLKLTVQK